VQLSDLFNPSSFLLFLIPYPLNPSLAFEELKTILDAIRTPERLNDHPWITSLVVAPGAPAGCLPVPESSGLPAHIRLERAFPPDESCHTAQALICRDNHAWNQSNWAALLEAVSWAGTVL